VKLKLTKQDLAKIDSGAHRKALIELGMYTIPTHKVHQDKSKYNRKSNQNQRWKEDV
jgi:hypothetical protein